MEITEEQKRDVERIINRMQCSKDFECRKSGFSKLSRISIIGDCKLLECLEKDPRACMFEFSFGHGTYCKCPLRFYIAKNFHR